MFQYHEHVANLEQRGSGRAEKLAHDIERSLRNEGVDATWFAEPLADTGQDGVLRVRWEGGDHEFPVIIKAYVRPAQLLLRDHPGPGTILMTDYVTDRLVTVLRQNGWQGFADAAGNASLVAPGLFVKITGQPRPKDSAPATLPFTRTGLPVTFALLVAQQRGEEWTQRRLTDASNSSLGTVNRVLRSLRESDPSPELLRTQWIASYLAVQPQAWPTERYSSRTWSSVTDVLSAHLPPGSLISSELAAYAKGASIRPTTVLLYCPEPSRTTLITEGRLRRDPEGPIHLRSAFWSPEVFADATEAPPFLVQADLLSEDDPRLTALARDIEDIWNG